jgi:hypothetical protein
MRTALADGPAARGGGGARILAPALLLCTGLAACGRDARPSTPANPPAAAAAPRPSPAPSRYGLRKGEEAAVQDFLARHPDLRFPTDSDRRVPAGGDGDVRHLYGVYHPYFVRGDLNDDGILDFVMAFVRRDSSASTPWFTVVVFSGRDAGSSPPGSFGPEIFLERDITLAAGDLSIDRDAVVITPDLDDETTRRYKWDPSARSYVFVREDEPESEPPDLSQT